MEHPTTVSIGDFDEELITRAGLAVNELFEQTKNDEEGPDYQQVIELPEMQALIQFIKGHPNPMVVDVFWQYCETALCETNEDKKLPDGITFSYFLALLQSLDRSCFYPISEFLEDFEKRTKRSKDDELYNMLLNAYFQHFTVPLPTNIDPTQTLEEDQLRLSKSYCALADRVRSFTKGPHCTNDFVKDAERLSRSFEMAALRHRGSLVFTYGLACYMYHNDKVRFKKWPTYTRQLLLSLVYTCLIEFGEQPLIRKVISWLLTEVPRARNLLLEIAKAFHPHIYAETSLQETLPTLLENIVGFFKQQIDLGIAPSALYETNALEELIAVSDASLSHVLLKLKEMDKHNFFKELNTALVTWAQVWNKEQGIDSKEFGPIEFFVFLLLGRKAPHSFFKEYIRKYSHIHLNNPLMKKWVQLYQKELKKAPKPKLLN